MMRLNKYIATCGFCSRRKADEYIKSGKVKLNGKMVTHLGVLVNEEKDEVWIEDKKIRLEDKKVYIMLNKPKGYITTSHEQFSRKSVMDLLKEEVRVFPVGRLDMYTDGLLLLTNDGEFANCLTHPKHHISKVYRIVSKEVITDEQVESLKQGVDIGDYITKEAMVVRVSEKIIKITIWEGKNRQIRRMCEAVGIPLIHLTRIQIGTVKLKDLPTGKYRYLTEKEKNSLYKKEC